MNTHFSGVLFSVQHTAKSILGPVHSWSTLFCSVDARDNIVIVNVLCVDGPWQRTYADSRKWRILSLNSKQQLWQQQVREIRSERQQAYLVTDMSTTKSQAWIIKWIMSDASVSVLMLRSVWLGAWKLVLGMPPKPGGCLLVKQVRQTANCQQDLIRATHYWCTLCIQTCCSVSADKVGQYCVWLI